jgi:hypothetical protein
MKNKKVKHPDVQTSTNRVQLKWPSNGLQIFCGKGERW